LYILSEKQVANQDQQFSPRHPNAAKAMANWERKSQYLLREIVKFRTYIDTLTAAQVQKQKIYAERAALEIEEDSVPAEGEGTNNDDGAKDAKPAPAPAPAPAFLLHP
jgi:hypothetical protein